MSTSTDTELRESADASLVEAQGILGLPAVVLGADVSGDDWWEGLATRAKNLLDKARKYHPMRLGAAAARKIRDAATRGLDKASTASDAVKATLASIAAAAGALALGPGILLGLLAFVLLEHTGYGARARSAGRRYVSRRARAYGL